MKINIKKTNKLNNIFKLFAISFSIAFISMFLPAPLAAEDYPEPTVTATSSVNWITRNFTTKLSLNTKQADLQMPTGKKTASNIIKYQMPVLIQSPLLSLFDSSNQNIEDQVIQERLTLDQVRFMCWIHPIL